MSNNDEKSAPEKAKAENKPVFFQVPDNWDDLNEEEQDKVLDEIIDAMIQG